MSHASWSLLHTIVLAVMSIFPGAALLTQSIAVVP